MKLSWAAWPSEARVLDGFAENPSVPLRIRPNLHQEPLTNQIQIGLVTNGGPTEH